MKRISWLLMLVLLAPAVSLQAEEPDKEDREKKPPVTELNLDQVPSMALAAARKTKPDVYFNSAEKMLWNDEPIYRLIGSKGRDVWSVYVNIQGQVRHVESDGRERD